MGGSTTISTSETRIEALKLQSSAYGVTWSWFCGVNRVKGNLAWYGAFQAIPHTTTESSGGKGGGVKTQNTTYTYRASVVMALGHGQITGVPRVWRGKTLYEGGVSPTQIFTVSEDYTPPASGAMTYTVVHAATFSAVVAVRYTDDTGPLPDRGTYTLSQGDDYTVANGVFTIVNEWYREKLLSISYQYTVAGVQQTALEQLGLTFKSGAIGQEPWAYLTGAFPDQGIGYSGLALVAGQDYDLGTGAQIENHTFEAQGPMAYHLGSTLPDVDVSLAMLDLLTNSRYGASFPTQRLDSWQEWSDYVVASGLLMSPLLEEQKRAADVVAEVAKLTNAAPVTSSGRLRIVPYGDRVETGNGRTYTPNTTPVYELTDDHFIVSEGEPPVEVRRKSPSDRYNHVRLEFNDRANQYNSSIAEAKDQADIDARGLRTMDTIRAPWITERSVAQKAAQLVMQRSLYIKAEYRFKLPPNFDLLEPMDLVTITDLGQGLDRLPVRVIDIDEDDEDQTYTCEDYPLGVASAPLYPSQVPGGFTHNYNVAPGDVAVPQFFEAPVELTSTGLEVYVAVRGQSTTWGGCNVWVSLDGTNYRRVQTLYGPARYGSLTGPVAGGAMPVSVVGQLLNGSSADAAALGTLCYVGGASPEYVAYTTATLTGSNAYSLGGLVRGAYSTGGMSAHTAGDPFVRVDEAIGKSGPLEVKAFVGKTIQFKFTSFNIYGGAEQSLADVPSYSYLITGVMAAIAPSAPTSPGYSLEPFGVRLKCAKNPEPDVVGYEWRVGSSPETGTVLDALGGTSHLWEVQLVGSFTAWVAAVDALGNRSGWTQVTGSVAGPSIDSLVASVVGSDLVLDYTSTPAAHAIDGYEISYGNTYATSTKVGYYYVTRHVRRIDWGGARRWWVVARDVRGNYGAPQSVDTSITVPGVVISGRCDVVDNNVLLYWAPPATGSLPIDRYEVRKGSSWAAGTVVGSNGNSTFGSVFETEANTYSYWIAAFDSADNEGTPVAIAATVNQPPDYVLRSNINSTFSGTASGMYVDPSNGRLYGPNRNETWEQHFVNQGWTTVDNQITAGYPLYFQPSAGSGTYEEIFDYGTTLPATTVTVTLNRTVLSGSVAVTVQIYYKLNAGDAWTAATAGASSVLVSNFRYTRVVWTFTASGGDDLIECLAFNIRLSVKQKTDSGNGTANAADSGGTTVTFNASFIDVESIVVTPLGTTARIAVYDFTDTPFPTTFKVLLFDNNGNRVSGTFSWTTRGY